MARERYDQLEDQIDDLAAELLASPAYQQASSAAARKKAAARFLMPRADGLSPPNSEVPNELHAPGPEARQGGQCLGERAVLMLPRGPVNPAVI
jgi:hypothetical protein